MTVQGIQDEDIFVGGIVKVLEVDTRRSTGVSKGDLLLIIDDDNGTPDWSYTRQGVEEGYLYGGRKEFEAYELPKNFECVGSKTTSEGSRFTGEYNKRRKIVVLKWCMSDGHSDNNRTEHHIANFLDLVNAGILNDIKALEEVPLDADEAVAQDATAVPGALGVFRPVLEDRKVGKVRIELVDFGFTNALWEVAKVMTWAQDVKGYKDHDWKNLPGAKDAFAAAASRHRMKHIMAVTGGQKLNEDGFTDEGYTDEESKFFHKAHEAFNILCELELMVTGKITTEA